MDHRKTSYYCQFAIVSMHYHLSHLVSHLVLNMQGTIKLFVGLVMALYLLVYQNWAMDEDSIG